jgi:hypothetical protein
MNPLNVETNLPISLLGSSLLARAKEGRMLHAFGHAIVVLLDGKKPGGKFTAFLNITPPGGGPGPHYRPAARSTVSKIIRISKSACSSMSLPRDLNISSPK